MPSGLTLGAVLERAPAADLLLVRLESVDEEGGLLPLKAGARASAPARCAARRCSNTSRPRPWRCPCAATCPPGSPSCKEGLFDGILLAEAGRLAAAAPPRRAGGVPPEPRPLAVRAGAGRGGGAVPRRRHRGASSCSAPSAPPGRPRGRSNLERDFLRILEGGLHHAVWLLHRRRARLARVWPPRRAGLAAPSCCPTPPTRRGWLRASKN